MCWNKDKEIFLKMTKKRKSKEEGREGGIFFLSLSSLFKYPLKKKKKKKKKKKL